MRDAVVVAGRVLAVVAAELAPVAVVAGRVVAAVVLAGRAVAVVVVLAGRAVVVAGRVLAVVVLAGLAIAVVLVAGFAVRWSVRSVPPATPR